MLKTRQSNFSNPKVWVVVGISVVAGVVVAVEAEKWRRNRKEKKLLDREDFGAFVERFVLEPFTQPPPPAAILPLAGLTFAIKDIFEVKGHIVGFGSPEWKRTHEEAGKMALVITSLLKNGATCVGSTVMDEMSFGITGTNVHYGTPVNPQLKTHIPGGSSSGSAVAVAAELVDFALGTDTIGGVRVPASFCGVLGFRPSHGTITMVGVVPNSQSLDTVGWFAGNPSILSHVGNVLLQSSSTDSRRSRRLIFADDLFELSTIPNQKTIHVVKKATESLSGYHTPKHMNLGQYIAKNVPILKGFHEKSADGQNGMAALKALSSVMILLQRYEFKTNHEDWVRSTKPKLGPDVSNHVRAAVDATIDSVKTLYKVRGELRAALQSVLQNDGILVFPTSADPPLKRGVKRSLSSEFYDRSLVLSSICSMSGCCQVTVPLGKHDGYPNSVSFMAFHGSDKFLLDTVVDIYPSLQEQVNLASNLSPVEDSNGHLDASELLKEKGNAAFKGRQWNKAVSYYSEAIKLSSDVAIYYCNRAAAFLQLGCFQKAEEDCTNAISIDKKNVKAYLRRGTARESLMRYEEASKDFKHALVLEPQNKVASNAEKRLKKLLS